MPQVRGVGWRHAAVTWDPCDSPTLPANTSLSMRAFDDIRRPDVRSVPLTEGCKEGKKRLDEEGRERSKSEYFIYILSN